mmetsp:Transcript_33482/g.51410  ORF Transcript_33482/g.51410 Transcript_33482/m.51410 type:complete len:95 (+) Transcript_33482:420-704(+)
MNRTLKDAIMINGWLLKTDRAVAQAMIESSTFDELNQKEEFAKMLTLENATSSGFDMIVHLFFVCHSLIFCRSDEWSASEEYPLLLEIPKGVEV